jgi:arginine/lysine/ornithine decarboxylase
MKLVYGDYMHMPLVSKLREYILNQPVPFHTPGHKGGRKFPAGLPFLPQMDLTEVPGLDNLQAPEGVIREAQELAARAFQSDACFFLVNGSTSGIHIMMMATLLPGERILIPRNCHKAVWGGLILSGAIPVYIQPEYDEEKGLVTHVSPQSVKRAVEENPDIKCMIITNPDYYGLSPHLVEIRNILSRRGIKLLVDEAHGSHLVFHPGLPPSASQCGADMWVQSAHKTLPALTQSSYLHVGYRGGDTDSKYIDKVSQVHRIMQSTSPSYLLMASLDWARAYMEEKGKESLDKLFEHLSWARKELQTLGIGTLENYKRPELYRIDPTRLVLDVSNLGLTGFEGEEILRQAGVQVEMADYRRLVLVCTITDKIEDFQKLVKACRFLPQEKREYTKNIKKMTISREIPVQMLSPKEAFEREKEFIPLKEARGRICGELAGAYPPGIPRFCPGELIDSQGIEELLYNQALGASLFGIQDDQMISVLVE